LAATHTHTHTHIHTHAVKHANYFNQRNIFLLTPAYDWFKSKHAHTHIHTRAIMHTHVLPHTNTRAIMQLHIHTLAIAHTHMPSCIHNAPSIGPSVADLGTNETGVSIMAPAQASAW
jgi:hypothetical protein